MATIPSSISPTRTPTSTAPPQASAISPRNFRRAATASGFISAPPGCLLMAPFQQPIVATIRRENGLPPVNGGKPRAADFVRGRTQIAPVYWAHGKNSRDRGGRRRHPRQLRGYAEAARLSGERVWRPQER